MKSTDQLVAWAKKRAADIDADLSWTGRDSDGFGGYWSTTETDQGGMMAQVAAALEFLQTYAGPDSQWFHRAKVAYETNADGASFGSGARAVGQILRSWAEQIEAGVTEVAGEAAAGV